MIVKLYLFTSRQEVKRDSESLLLEDVSKANSFRPSLALRQPQLLKFQGSEVLDDAVGLGLSFKRVLIAVLLQAEDGAIGDLEKGIAFHCSKANLLYVIDGECYKE